MLSTIFVKSVQVIEFQASVAKLSLTYGMLFTRTCVNRVGCAILDVAFGPEEDIHVSTTTPRNPCPTSLSQ